MQPSQLNILPQEQACLLIRKKRFWKKVMWLSLAITPLILAIGAKCHSMASRHLLNTVIAMKQNEMTESLHNSLDHIGDLFWISRLALALSALASLLFLTALIRTLSLPKLPAPPPNS